MVYDIVEMINPNFLIILLIVYFIVYKILSEINILRHNLHVISFIMSFIFSYFSFDLFKNLNIVILLTYGFSFYLIYTGFLIPGLALFYYTYFYFSLTPAFKVSILIGVLSIVNGYLLKDLYLKIMKGYISWFKKIKIILFILSANFLIFLTYWWVNNPYFQLYELKEILLGVSLFSLIVFSIFLSNEIVFLIIGKLGMRWGVLKSLESEIKRLERELEEINKEIEKEEMRYAEYPEDQEIIEKRLEFLNHIKLKIENQLEANKLKLKKKIKGK